MTNGPDSDAAHRPETAESAIEAHLDQLFRTLAGHSATEARHLLHEAEAHLRDAAAEAEAQGLTPAAAGARAVERFGAIGELVAAERRRHATPVSVVVRQLLSTALLLGSLGAIAVGISGVLAGAMRAAAGSAFVVDRPRAGTLGASDCSRWLGARPLARTCAAAAQADWADETIWYRIGLGVLGLAGLLVLLALRRRLARQSRWNLLPGAAIDAVGAVVFGGTGLWLLGLGADALVVSSGHGAGQWLSAAPIALALGTVFTIRLIADLRHFDPSPALA